MRQASGTAGDGRNGVEVKREMHGNLQVGKMVTLSEGTWTLLWVQMSGLNGAANTSQVRGQVTE